MTLTVQATSGVSSSRTNTAGYDVPSSSGSSFANILSEAAQPNQEEKNAAYATSVKRDFEKWQSAYSTRGISDSRRQEVEEYSGAFGNIVDKAAANGGYDDPQAFLKSLSSSELETLQHIHGLADPINPDGLSKEGALNLLYSPDQTRDIDKDGFETVGVAKTWRFPPPDAPADVKAAWDRTVASMGEKDALLLSASFMPLADPRTGLAANAYLGADTDYPELTRKAIEGAIASSKYDQPWQTEWRTKEISGLRAFLDNLGSA